MTDDVVTLNDMRLEAKDRIEALTAQIAEDADARALMDDRLEQLVAEVNAQTARAEAAEAERDKWQAAHSQACAAWQEQCEHEMAKTEAAEADAARLREERDAILSDSTIHSDQREKYERLCARIAAGKASQQDAVDAIRQLCRDNERLALRRSDDRAALKGDSHE